MWKYKNALKLALDYIKSPYHLLEPTIYSKDAHDHICFVRRLMGKDYKDVCPYRAIIDFSGAELSDCCDMCPYFGIINYCCDESGEKSVEFVMDNKIVDTFGGENNEH